MKCKFLSVISMCIFPVLFLIPGACAQKEPTQANESKTAPAAAQKSESKSPPGFGIYYESAEGLFDLEKNPVLAAANPSFLIYLENMPEVEKLRMRFGKGAGVQRVVVMSSSEKDDVFEAEVSAIEGKKDMYRAAYSGTLKPGSYIAYYFIDESKGNKKWESARFQFAGQFTVK